MLKTAFVAAASLFIGTAAFAQSTTATLQYGTFEKDGFNIDGAILDIEGSHDRVYFDLDAAASDAEGFDVSTSTARLHWSGIGSDTLNVGPAVSYSYATIEEEGDGFWSAGIGATAQKGAYKARAYAMAPIDDSEYWNVDLQLDTQLTPRTTLLQSYNYQKSVFSDIQTYELGARYNVTPALFLEGGMALEHSANETGTGFVGGLGMRF